ncbi:HMG box-containing protein 4 isoform X2 [Nasonia vitripennis]|uniref:HMG box domain-containing protein n=1 Tax=Nasonia vitripennis TaxID=7425 RepID=A0A7M7G2X2_NASVI|nr:HMG box-containing protein 4 isoform X2 [Nasonia vitripennis]
MDSFVTPKREGNELEVTGISRSGRVRKKSSKLMDFESSSNITETKIKRPKMQSPQDQPKKKKPTTTDGQPLSPVPQVTHTVHVAQIHHPPPNKITIAPPKKSPKLPTTPIQQKKKKIESSSDYETQSQSTNSESEDDVVSKKLHIAEFSSKDMSLDALEPAEDEITTPKKKPPSPKKPKKTVTIAPSVKPDIKPKPTKPELAQKPKPRYTAYMLWSKEMRQQLLKESPNMDFTSISKRLGELWATVPNMEKYNWSNRAKRLAEKNQMSPPKKFITKSNIMKSPSSDSPKKKTDVIRISDLKKLSPQSIRSGKDATRDPTKEMKIFRAIELQPIDVAAYLKLLGESLTVIGERLKEHNGQITVSGSLSVLLDSLLCALGSLMCLTQQVPAIGTQNSASLSKTLENIAYIMPGL